MQDTETLHLLMKCREEIAALRRQVDELMPRAEAFASIQQILAMIPKSGGIYAEDVLWRLSKHIEEMQRADIKPEPQIVCDDEGGGQ